VYQNNGKRESGQKCGSFTQKLQKPAEWHLRPPQKPPAIYSCSGCRYFGEEARLNQARLNRARQRCQEV
jgi:hypothetical protein